MSDETPGVFKQMVTQKDNVTHSFARWCALLAVPFYHGGIILNGFFAVMKSNPPFEPTAYGLGLAAVFAASGTWIFFEGKAG